MANPKYEPTDKHIATAETLASQGATNIEIAKALGIGRTTFFKHTRTFASALKKGREKWWDDSVAQGIEKIGLKKLVFGFEYTEKTTEEKFNKYGVLFDTTKYVTKFYPPNVAAIIFALCNRNPDRWKNINDPFRGQGITQDVVDQIAAGLTTLDADTVPFPTESPDTPPPGPPVPSLKRRSPVPENAPRETPPVLRIHRSGK